MKNNKSFKIKHLAHYVHSLASTTSLLLPFTAGHLILITFKFYTQLISSSIFTKLPKQTKHPVVFSFSSFFYFLFILMKITLKVGFTLLWAIAAKNIFWVKIITHHWHRNADKGNANLILICLTFCTDIEVIT